MPPHLQLPCELHKSCLTYNKQLYGDVGFYGRTEENYLVMIKAIVLSYESQSSKGNCGIPEIFFGIFFASE